MSAAVAENRFPTPAEAAELARAEFMARFRREVIDRAASVAAGQPIVLVYHWEGETFGFGSLTRLKAELASAGWRAELDSQGKALYIEPAEVER